MNDPTAARVLRVVNILLLLVLAAVVALVYWYAVRPLAKTSGAVDAAVAAPVEVKFDTLGEPHIRASSLSDAFFAQGYVTAQERLFQMDLLRRVNAGELSEVFGARALDADREARRLRLRRIADQAYGTLPAADRQ